MMQNAMQNATGYIIVLGSGADSDWLINGIWGVFHLAYKSDMSANEMWVHFIYR